MSNRIGFHYYDDQEHFTAADLDLWLPRLKSLGASWLVLRSSLERMVPEFFIAGLLAAGIEPVLRIPGHPIRSPDVGSLRRIFDVYRRWGVRYVTLFEGANRRAAWTGADWTRPSLIERFLDCLLPALDTMSAAGLTPVIPPLAAGGDYWDTAFFDSLLASMIQRGYDEALREMAVGVYHFVGNRPLDWGRGGPEAWPAARPYLTTPGVEDQRGFYRTEWIDVIVRQRVGMSLNQLVIAGGAVIDAHDLPDRPPVDPLTHAEVNLEIVRRMQGGQVPPSVLNTAFWLLSGSPQGWWPSADGEPLPAVARLAAWVANGDAAEVEAPTLTRSLPSDAAEPEADKPLEHYVLLPPPEDGAPDCWDVLRDYVKTFRPVCGFSPNEAGCARHVTIIGDTWGVPAAAEADLRAAGCLVRRIAAADREAIADALDAMVRAGEPYGPPTPFGHRA